MAKNPKVPIADALAEYDELYDSDWLLTELDEYEDDDWGTYGYDPEDDYWEDYDRYYEDDNYHYRNKDKSWQIEVCWAEYNASKICPDENPASWLWTFVCHKQCTSWIELWERLEEVEELEAMEELWDLGYDDELWELGADEVRQLLHLEIEQATVPTARRASRRRKTFIHKQRVLRNADVAAKAYNKRRHDDVYGFYCRLRAGREVHMPKSKGLRAINLCNRAAKLHA